jgi:DNA-binding transcriptional LysR family regulator
LPGLQLEIDAANEVVDLFKGNVDFALRVADEHHPDLVAKYLGRMRDVICASPAFIAANRADYGDAREMERLECIQHSMHPEWNVWNLIPRKVSKKTPAAEAIKLRTHGRISCNQYSVIHSLCVAGRGVARMPYYMAEHDIKQGRLVHLFDDYEISTHRLYLVYLKPSYATQRQETLKREILEWFHSRRDVLANSEG